MLMVMVNDGGYPFGAPSLLPLRCANTGDGGAARLRQLLPPIRILTHSACHQPILF